MALEIKNVGHVYGDAAALHNVSFRAEPGQITCLLGASGCGKTTLLRLLAGMLPLEEGEISLDGEVLAKRGMSPPPEKRPVGLVFQEGALFPHMSVAKNIGYGLAHKEQRRETVDELLRRVGLDGFGSRYPHTLSGGQQQRVALARALAPGPRVLLLDEPFASIDIIRRRSLREETARLLKERGCISVLVTHDPEEAVEIADHIVVLAQGEMVGQGTAADLYDAPPNETVGTLIGGGVLLPARLNEDGIMTPFGKWSHDTLTRAPGVTGPVNLLVRRDAVTLSPDAEGYAVTDSRRVGAQCLIRVASPDGQLLSVLMDQREGLAPGDKVVVSPKEASLHAFPA
ncbi:MAG: ABC transporter ATP-binding protein [Pseudomonadota bacterium]